MAIMAVFGLSTFFVAMTDAFIAVFVGLERMSVLTEATIIAKVVGTVVTIPVLLAGGQALAVVIVLAAANLLGMLILVASFRPLPASDSEAGGPTLVEYSARVRRSSSPVSSSPPTNSSTR